MRVELAPAALRDLVRLEDFLAEKSESASRRAVEAISTALETLARFPSCGAELSNGSKRRLIVPFGKGSYLLDYAVREDLVLVLRIRHSREER